MVDEPMDAFEQPPMAEETDAAGDAVMGRLQRRALPLHGRADRDGAAAGGGKPKGAAATPGGRIAEAIEAALFPRLVLVHGGRMPAVEPVAAEIAALVDRFTQSLTTNDDAVTAMALVERLRAGGTSFETICLDLMAPAARRLGAMWETDDCDFALVTLGLSRLHRLMHAVDAQIAAAMLPIDRRRVALLAVTPGEQHVFGIAMVGDFLRRAGWEIHDAVGATSAEIAESVRRTWFAVAALSCSAEAGLDGLAGRVTAIRGRSRNRGIAILVGGYVFADRPEAAIRVGADAMALDARAAVWQAERLLARCPVDAVAG